VFYFYASESTELASSKLEYNNNNIIIIIIFARQQKAAGVGVKIKAKQIGNGCNGAFIR